MFNGNGEQYDISDPRYAYQDGLENTRKYPESSVDNLFSTPDAAQARSLQIGCGGFHIVVIDGQTYYKPCETPEYYATRIEQLESALNFTYIGSYRVLTWDKPFENISVCLGWIIDAANSLNVGSALNNDIAIDFRYSVDGKTWSLWSNVGTVKNGLTGQGAEIFPIYLNPENKFYPEFRFTSVLVNDNGTLIYRTDEPIDPNVVIVDFQLDLELGPDPAEVTLVSPVPVCSNEVSNRPVIFSDCKFTFNPYAVNKALNLYQDLSLIVNKVFGLDANYYSVQPQGRGKDVILKEYTLFNVVAEKCVKILVPQNQFPDNKINFDPFGLQFEDPFEIQIDKRYFESIFGKGSQPRKRDIIYFPLSNRIYEINSTYLFRDFMNSPVYFKIELRKYSPKSNTYFLDPEYKEQLDGITLTTPELFGEETKAEEEKYSKPQQFSTTITQLSQDPIRSYIYESLPIIGYDLNNNWTIVLNHYYDLIAAFDEVSEFQEEQLRYRNAIRYKVLPNLKSEDELAFTCWFNLRDFYDPTKLVPKPYPIINISLESSNDEFLIFNSYPAKHKLQVWLDYSSNPEGYVSIQGDSNHSGGYIVEEVIDEYRFKIKNLSTSFSEGTIVWKMQKAQARNFISGLYEEDFYQTLGIRIDLIHSGITDPDGNLFLQQGSFIVRINNEIINSKLQFTPEDGTWYGFVLNLSNIYKQISINAWGLTYDPINPSDQSSKLEKLHEDIRFFDSPKIFSAPPDPNTNNQSVFFGTDNNSYKVFTGPLFLSNIRLFKNMIDIDNQSTVLNQNIVRDNQLAYIIDNAKPLINVPKFARNR